MTDEIRGAEPTQVIIDELSGTFSPEDVRKWAAILILAGESGVSPARQAQHHVYNTNTSGFPLGDPWAPQPYVSPANQDVRSDAADPGDQTYTHDATVATLPVDVARRLCEEHPILRSLITFHTVEDNDGDTDKLCQGAAIDLAVSIMDAGHLWKQARPATGDERFTRVVQQEAARLANGAGVAGNAYRAMSTEQTQRPVNSNPAKSGARARRKAKRKAKGKRR